MQNVWYIELLDCHETPTSRAQVNQILESLRGRLRPEFACVPLKIRVRYVQPALDPSRPLESQAVLMVDQFGLTAQEWRTLPVIPRLPADPVIAKVVLREINRRRGYVWPIVRPKPQNQAERDLWEHVVSPDEAVDAIATCNAGNWSVVHEDVPFRSELLPAMVGA